MYIDNINTIYKQGGAMDIIISNSDKRPIYEQIRSQIKEKIMTGELGEGEALPSMRLLAKELRISVITTKRAYDELEQDGFIVTVQGRGTFVAKRNLEFIREEQLKKIEEHLLEAINQAKYGEISLEELKLIMDTLYKEG